MPHYSHILIFSVLSIASLSFPHRVQAASLLSNFYDVLVNPNGDIDLPTAMAIAPDGRIFVCEQGGNLRVIKNGQLLAAPFLTATVDSTLERGLLGMAFDPGFASNRYLYLYYTAVTPSPHNRVSRFRASAVNPDVVEAASEAVLMDLEDLAAPNHNGGAMHFGPDGKLYVAVGENGMPVYAQSVTNRLGKILRLNPDPLDPIPATNPFYSTPYQGVTVTGLNRAIWALGFRNPFTFAFQAPTGRLYINDVGQNTWEEINDGIAGANYGWPDTEGSFNQAAYPAYTHPVFNYNSGGFGPTGTECAITGGTFYNPGQVLFPASYLGKYFFADYCAGWVRFLDPPASGVTTGVSTAFASGYNAPVDLQVGPDGALYVLTGANSSTGRVYRVHYSTSTAPAIGVPPSSLTVTTGENASFTVLGSGTAPLTHVWQNNGFNIPNSNSSIYTLNNAQLADNGDVFWVILSNSSGSVTSAPATLTVTSNTPPSPVIDLPALGAPYDAGQTLAFSGSATDAQDGILGAPAFSWWIHLHHDLHSHPAMPLSLGVTSGNFVLPNTGETSENVWYRLYLAAADSGGRAATVTRDVLPSKAALVFQTSPAGLQLNLEGIPFTAPATVVSVVGMIRALGAPDQGANLFSSWSDAGARDHNVTVGAGPATYTANFTVLTSTPTFTPTFTPSPSPTPTGTLTPSATPTATFTLTPSSGFNAPYPNPAPGAPLHFGLSLPGQASVKWSVHTLTHNKIRESRETVGPAATLSWDLLDQWGTPVANGLYYLRLEVEGSGGKRVKVWKVLIHR